MLDKICIEKAIFYTCCATVPTPMTDISPLNQLDPKQFESPAILKKLASASRKLAELKGVAASIPNQAILINTLVMQEAKDSSAIENIVTTHDELFKGDALPESVIHPAAVQVGCQVVRYPVEPGACRTDLVTLDVCLTQADEGGLHDVFGLVRPLRQELPGIQDQPGLVALHGVLQPHLSVVPPVVASV